MGALGWSPGPVRLGPSWPLDLPRAWHLPPSASAVRLFFPSFASPLPCLPFLVEIYTFLFLFVSDFHDLLSPLPSSSFSFLSPHWSLCACVFLSPCPCLSTRLPLHSVPAPPLFAESSGLQAGAPPKRETWSPRCTPELLSAPGVEGLGGLAPCELDIRRGQWDGVEHSSKTGAFARAMSGKVRKIGNGD